MRKEFTLAEMTQMQLVASKPDPLYKNQQLPKFLCSHTQPAENTKSAAPILRHYLTQNAKKSLPPDHYLEHRFKPYLKVKSFKKNLFTQISQLKNCLSERTPSNNRFKTSKYPQVPLSKELMHQVESVNTFRKVEKTPPKSSSIRPCSQLSNNQRCLGKNKSSKVMVSLKSSKIYRKNSVFCRNEDITMRNSELESSRSFDNILSGKKEDGVVGTTSSCNTIVTPARRNPRFNDTQNIVHVPYTTFVQLFD